MHAAAHSGDASQVETRRDLFNEEEEDFYEALYSESRTRFVSYVQEGTLLNNYAHIFELLMRMRQAADHPFLVTHRHQETRDGVSPRRAGRRCSFAMHTDAIGSRPGVGGTAGHDGVRRVPGEP